MNLPLIIWFALGAITSAFYIGYCYRNGRITVGDAGGSVVICVGGLVSFVVGAIACFHEFSNIDLWTRHD